MNNVLESLKNLGVAVTETMTTPTRPRKKPRPVWVVSGNTFGLEDFFYQNGGKKFRGAWSFFTDPSSAILQELNTNGRKGFAEQMQSVIDRKMARAEKFEGYSENAAVRSEVAHKKANSIMSMIPPGQPILVGHHSERRHRRDLERIDSGMRKSIEESKKSEHYSHKANFLNYQVGRMTESRQYVANRLKETQRALNSLQRWAEKYTDVANQSNLRTRIAQAKEKLEFWQGRMKELEAKAIESTGTVASPETIKVGDEIYYSGWLPVIRINRKTVTVSHWLGVPKLQYKIEYTRIQKFRTPNKN